MEQSRMTQDDVLFGYRLRLFALAARTSVSHACRVFGVHRLTYYAWKRQVAGTRWRSFARASAGARRCPTRCQA
jgi:hypothetical protein